MRKASGTWEHKVLSDFVRIDVTISTRQPELLKDIQAVSEPRLRPERLRFLAQLGLLVLQGRGSLAAVQAGDLEADNGHEKADAGEAGGTSVAAHGTAETVATHEPKRALSPARRKAMAQLGQSLAEPSQKTQKTHKS